MMSLVVRNPYIMVIYVFAANTLSVVVCPFHCDKTVFHLLYFCSQCIDGNAFNGHFLYCWYIVLLCFFLDRFAFHYWPGRYFEK